MWFNYLSLIEVRGRGPHPRLTESGLSYKVEEPVSLTKHLLVKVTVESGHF